MDLIYTDRFGKDLGMAAWWKGDFSIGEENSFEVELPADLPIEQGCRLYIDGTEYGGIVDGVEADTAAETATYAGRTWHGILASCYIVPPAGQSHRKVSGEANAVIAELVAELGLSQVFAVSAEDSGVHVDHEFPRYENDAYADICAMLAAAGATLGVAARGRMPELAAAKRGEHVQAGGLDSDGARFEVSISRPVNHVIGLGSGEGDARQVVNLYADETGNVSDRQTQFGAEHRAEVYERSNESGEELLASCREHLAELQQGARSVRLVSLDADRYGIGDVVSGVDHAKGLMATAVVGQKIASMGERGCSVELKAKGDE